MPSQPPLEPVPLNADPLDLPTRLGRWVEAGLISPDQAAAIAAAEQGRADDASPAEAPVSRAEPAGRRPYVVEGLGYVGGSLAFLAGAATLNELWPEASPRVHALWAFTAAVVLLGVGAGIRPGVHPSFVRIRSVLWGGSTASLAAALGMFQSAQWHLSGPQATLLVSLVTLPFAGVLYALTHHVVQQLAGFVTLVVAAASLPPAINPDLGRWAPGLMLWLLGLLGLALARTRRLPRPAVSQAAAAAGLILGAALTMSTPAGNVLALVTVALLLGAGIVARDVVLLAIGALSVLVLVPGVVTRYLPEGAGAAGALFAVGVVLLGLTVYLARRGPHQPKTPAARP